MILLKKVHDLEQPEADLEEFTSQNYVSQSESAYEMSTIFVAS